MEVESQAIAISKNNSRVIITKGQKVNLPMQHNFEHECMILQYNIANWMQQKLTQNVLFLPML